MVSEAATPPDAWRLPISTHQIPNGLVVVVSEDHSSPTVGVSVVYKVGTRTEPRGRAGFAHLFEHLMFEGTPAAPQGVFDRVVEAGGGDNNASTHPDFTSYVDRAPVSALEPLLWLEADRMRSLAFDQRSLDGQRDVVKEEIRVNVLNHPYGGFATADLPLLAFSKWENGHDGYGSFDDLDRASLADVRAFHREHYGPGNAVLAIAGDVTPEQGFALAQKYFGAIPARPVPPVADVEEPLNTAGKLQVEGDALARLPALAVGWKMPSRGSADQAAMIVLGQVLAGGGDASRLHQALVKGRAQALQVEDFTGSGSPWEYAGPTLYTVVVIHKVEAKAADVLATIDAQIARIRSEGVDARTLAGAKAQLLADWYDDLEPFADRAEHLAILQAVWGDAGIVNHVPDRIDAVTSADLQRVAGMYLTDGNRSVVERVPDFMLPPGDPARSDRRAKAKPKPAPRKGTVVVGELQEVAPAPKATPAAKPATEPGKKPGNDATEPKDARPAQAPRTGALPAAGDGKAPSSPATKPTAPPAAPTIQPAPAPVSAAKPAPGATLTGSSADAATPPQSARGTAVAAPVPSEQKPSTGDEVGASPTSAEPRPTKAMPKLGPDTGLPPSAVWTQPREGTRKTKPEAAGPISLRRTDPSSASPPAGAKASQVQAATTAEPPEKAKPPAGTGPTPAPASGGSATPNVPDAPKFASASKAGDGAASKPDHAP